MPEKGVLYIVSGPKEIFRECAHSIATLKKHNPDIPVQVIASRNDPIIAKSGADFVDLMDEPLHPLKAKVRYLLNSRFDRTLFLDADTEIRESLHRLFDENTNVNFAATHDNLCDWAQTPPRFLAQESEDINTGLLYYDSSPFVRNYLAEWFRLLEDQDESEMRPGFNCDQEYFNRHLRDRVYNDTDVAATLLPNHIYTVRPWCWPILKRNQLFSFARILHAHHLHHGVRQKFYRKVAALIKNFIGTPAAPNKSCAE